MRGIKTTSHLVPIVLFAMVMAACTKDEVLDASYESRAEAEAAGAIARGWIPEWLPANASDIHEVHDLDTNEGALAFSLPPGANWRPPSACRTAQGGEFSEPRFSRDWIPKLDASAAYFSCPGEQAEGTPLLEAVAVQPDGQRVLYWRVFSR